MDATLSWQSEMEVNSPTYIRPIPDFVDQTLLNELEERHSILGEYCPKPTLEILREGRDSHFIVELALRPHECGGCRALRVGVKSHKETISELRSEVKSHKETISELKKDNAELRSEVKLHGETISELKKDNAELKKDSAELKKDMVSRWLEKAYLFGRQLYDQVCEMKLYPLINREYGERFTSWEEVKLAMRKGQTGYEMLRKTVNKKASDLFDFKDDAMFSGLLFLIGRRNVIAHPSGSLSSLVGKLEKHLELIPKPEIPECDRVIVSALHGLAKYVKENETTEEDETDLFDDW